MKIEVMIMTHVRITASALLAAVRVAICSLKLTVQVLCGLMIAWTRDKTVVVTAERMGAMA